MDGATIFGLVGLLILALVLFGGWGFVAWLFVLFYVLGVKLSEV